MWRAYLVIKEFDADRDADVCVAAVGYVAVVIEAPHIEPARGVVHLRLLFQPGHLMPAPVQEGCRQCNN
jgi:hypothetical protein